MVTHNSNLIYLMAQQGLGDHLLCNGIYNEFSSRFQKVFLPVTQKYARTVKRMLRHTSNIQVINYRSDLLISSILNHSILLEKRGIARIPLGVWPTIETAFDELQFDKQMYKQAGLNFDSRWSSFHIERDYEIEERLYSTLGCNLQPYLFLHEDTARGFLIDRSRLNPKLKIVTPLKPKEHSIFDYLSVISRAQEIHCIESSFAALIESMSISVPLFAHRYARPEVTNDYRRAFTYRSNWNILLGN